MKAGDSRVKGWVDGLKLATALATTKYKDDLS